MCCVEAKAARVAVQSRSCRLGVARACDDLAEVSFIKDE